MNSLKKIAELAARFEKKLSLAQDTQPGAAENVMFGDQSKQQDFMNYLGKDTSHLMKALSAGAQVKNVGVQVSTKNKLAKFLTAPLSPAVEAALNEDYKTFYGASPNERLASLISSNDPTVKSGVEAISPKVISW